MSPLAAARTKNESAANKPRFDPRTVRRMTVSEYQKTAFVGRPPCLNTLRAQIRSGSLPGEIRGRSYYVYVDQYGQPLADAAEDARQSRAEQVMFEWLRDAS